MAADVQPIDETLAPGASVDTYTVEHTLGVGGFATVYRARHRELGTRVAIKVLSRALTSDADAMRRFVREAQTASTLVHPNIVRVLAFGRLDDGRAYQVMELVDGPSLDQYVKQVAPLEVARVLAILGEVARALGFAHARGVVHRDLKPANILLDSTAALTPRLTDFGIAKALDTDGDTKLTHTGVTLGTPAYMSPEQAMGTAVGPASDIYAFGVMAFELLTGTEPYEGESPFAVMMKHVQAPVPAVSSLAPQHAAFDGVLRRLLAKQPADRPPTIEEAMAELAAAADAGVPPPRRRLGWIGALVVAVAAIGVTVAMTRSSTDPTIATPQLEPAPLAVPDAAIRSSSTIPDAGVVITTPDAGPTKPSIIGTPPRSKPKPQPPKPTDLPASDQPEIPPTYPDN